MTLTLQIPGDWTPEQALAVYELIDEIREAIWSRYELPLIELLREERVTRFEVDDDEPF